MININLAYKIKKILCYLKYCLRRKILNVIKEQVKLINKEIGYYSVNYIYYFLF